LRGRNSEASDDLERETQVEDGPDVEPAAVCQRNQQQRGGDRRRRRDPAESAREKHRSVLRKEDRQKRVTHEEDERILQRQEPKPLRRLGEELWRKASDACSRLGLAR